MSEAREWKPPKVIWILSPVMLTRREQWCLRRVRDGYSIPERNAWWLERKGMIRRTEKTYSGLALTFLAATCITDDPNSILFQVMPYQYPSGEPWQYREEGE